MNYKTTVAIVLLLAVVGGYFYFVERNAPPRPTDNASLTLDTAQPLFTADQLSTEAIDRVTLDRGDEHYVFRKEDTDWFQVEPVRFKLNAWNARSLVDKAATLKRYGTLKGETVADPFAVVTLEDTAAGKTYTLRLGATTIGGRARLLLDDEKDARLVSDTLHEAVRNLKVNDLRNKTLQAPGASRADSLVIERESDTLKFLKVDDNHWYLDDAHTQRAAVGEVNRIFGAFSSLAVERFVADDPPRLDVYGLDSPRITVTLTSPQRTVPDTDTVEPGEVITLKIGRPADLNSDAFFAQRTRGDQGGNVVFTLTKQTVQPFLTEADQVRDSKVFNTPLAQVTRVTIARPEGALSLERRPGGAFAFTEPKADYSVDYSETTGVLGKALDLAATGFQADFQPDGEPALRVTINDETAAFYAANDAYWVLRDGETVASRVTAQDVAPLLDADVAALRNRTVLDLKPEQIAAVTLNRSTGPAARFVRTDGDDWALEGAADFERRDFTDLLNLLAPLRVSAWAGSDDADPGDVLGEIKIETRDGATHALTVGSNFSFLEGVDEMFTVPAGLGSRVGVEFRPRALIRLVPRDIQSIVRTTGDATESVRLENNVFQWDDQKPISGQAAATLFDTVAGLSADHFVTHQTFAAETPAATLLVTPADAPTITLKLMSDGQTATIEPGPEEPGQQYRTWFTLDEATWRKLTAPLAQSAQPLPDADDLIESK